MSVHDFVDFYESFCGELLTRQFSEHLIVSAGDDEDEFPFSKRDGPGSEVEPGLRLCGKHEIPTDTLTRWLSLRGDAAIAKMPGDTERERELRFDMASMGLPCLFSVTSKGEAVTSGGVTGDVFELSYLEFPSFLRNLNGPVWSLSSQFECFMSILLSSLGANPLRVIGYFGPPKRLSGYACQLCLVFDHPVSFDDVFSRLASAKVPPDVLFHPLRDDDFYSRDAFVHQLTCGFVSRVVDDPLAHVLFGVSGIVPGKWYFLNTFLALCVIPFIKVLVVFVLLTIIRYC